MGKPGCLGFFCVRRKTCHPAILVGKSLVASGTYKRPDNANCLNYAVATRTAFGVHSASSIRPSLLQPEGLIGAPDFPTWAS